MASIASEVGGRSVARVLVDPERWTAQRVDGGQPEAVARFTLGMYEAAAAGFFAGTDPLLRTLLGRAPRSVRDELEHPTAH